MRVKIELNSISKRFSDAGHDLVVIDQLSFTFPESGSVAIVGRSGIGKSTLLQLMGGLERPSSGEVLYGGESLALMGNDELSAFRGARVGFIFQFHHLLPEFSALENVAMPLIIGGSSDVQALERAEEVLVRVGLKERLAHRPGQLSGGEQQRVAIARAIVGRPAVILADEPTGNLDQATAETVQGLLMEINRELSNLLVIVTHSMELARSTDMIVEMLPGGELRRIDGGRARPSP